MSYDSGAGNGPFGWGWNLSLTRVTRKTDKGLPQYRDADESDVFILAGAEDLVPVLQTDGRRFEDRTTFPGFIVCRYRPRIEGLFARIERWTNQATGEIHWRSISKGNITTLYGQSSESRIEASATDSAGPRTFSWLICESFDDKGNAVVYRYKSENSDDVSDSLPHEQNRQESRSTNRYIKSIYYGNRISRLLPEFDAGAASDQPLADPNQWMFEVVFDYGEHGRDVPRPAADGSWLARNDPFSSYRAGFEVRTYRLCQRILMFHHFRDEPGVGNDCLVRSLDIEYRSTRDESMDKQKGNPIASFIAAVTQQGYTRQPAPAPGYLIQPLPPLEFQYSDAVIDERNVFDVDRQSLENLPAGLSGGYQWIDLDSEGLSGILTEAGDGWYYKRNTAANNLQEIDSQDRAVARLAPVELVKTKPNASIAMGQAQFMDLAGDGLLDLVQFDGPQSGFYERTADRGWESFRPFRSTPNLDTRNPNVKFVDLDGDGRSDVLFNEDEVFTWHPSLGEDGYGAALQVRKALDDEHGPRTVVSDDTQAIFLVDMSGDGLADLVRIANGEVCYWPNLGYGRFGARVTMDDSPWFDHPEAFEPRRIRLADIDGSGVTDIIYLAHDGVRLYFNQSGNSWTPE
ncbi:MAG TPA: SpvB/TcaC N-terminal domain-containing protein, partial [Planctomycetaceae bacterium]